MNPRATAIVLVASAVVVIAKTRGGLDRLQLSRQAELEEREELERALLRLEAELGAHTIRLTTDKPRQLLDRRAPRHPLRTMFAAPNPRGSEVDVLVAALGLSESELERALDVLAARPAAGRASTLFVVDADVFLLLRQRESRFEFVPPRSDWQRHFGAMGYERFVKGRMAELVDVYAPARILALGALSTATLAALSPLD